MKRIVTLVLMIIVFSNNAFSLETSDTYRLEETANTDPKLYAYIGPIEIAAPLNHFLIVKKGQDICAIRFTDYRRAHDGKKPNLFSGGEENLFAEYDWHYLGKDPQFFGKSGHEKLNRAPTIQILGFHGFLPGNRSIICGTLRLDWVYPIAVGYMGEAGSYLKDLEIAITPWTDVSQINLNNKKIHWYPFDSERRETFIHFKELFTETNN